MLCNDYHVVRVEIQHRDVSTSSMTRRVEHTAIGVTNREQLCRFAAAFRVAGLCEVEVGRLARQSDAVDHRVASEQTLAEEQRGVEDADEENEERSNATVETKPSREHSAEHSSGSESEHSVKCHVEMDLVLRNSCNEKVGKRQRNCETVP